jgi:GNAT superfamily N-acetyltransferase
MENSSTRRIASRGQDAVQRDLGLNERLGLISLIDEGTRMKSPESPIVADLFNNLWDLVNKTVSGSRINRLKPQDSYNGFRVIEVNSEIGENLGRLNMLYLRKPIPCYYLVYVEVGAPFRRKGLGTQILKHFRKFLIRRSAVGILDNIIPKEDPTYDIYLKLSWRPVESIVGDTALADRHYYMIFTPPGMEGKDLKGPVLKLLHHLSRKRTAIDMRDNQIMVQRTIEEFKVLHSALMTYFGDDVDRGESSPLMRFMFTRFVTKFIAFRRRIETLVGYTGGDSLEQIALAPEIAQLPAQSYAPFDLENGPTLVDGDIKLWNQLPEAFKKHPAHFIEGLPNYERPSLTTWLKEQGGDMVHPLTIGNLMDLGFDPTRLKEINVDSHPCIFERIQVKQLPDLKQKEALLREIKSKMQGWRIKNACLKVNSPFLTIRDRGNAYVLRRKIGGIHWEEAVEQIQSSPRLKGLDRSLKLHRMIAGTVREATQAISGQLNVEENQVNDLLTCFVSWDIKGNQPLLMVDFSNSYLTSIWMS